MDYIVYIQSHPLRFKYMWKLIVFNAYSQCFYRVKSSDVRVSTVARNNGTEISCGNFYGELMILARGGVILLMDGGRATLRIITILGVSKGNSREVSFI